MQKDEIAKLLKFIKGAYPNFVVNEDVTNTWEVMLKDQTFDRSMQLAKSHIMSGKEFPPLVGQIYERKPLSTFTDWEKEASERQTH